jgi:hypothetical protein
MSDGGPAICGGHAYTCGNEPESGGSRGAEIRQRISAVRAQIDELHQDDASGKAPREQPGVIPGCPGTAELVPLLQIALQDRCAHRTRTMVQVARSMSLIFLRRAVPDVRNDLSWAATGMSDRMSRGRNGCERCR